MDLEIYIERERGNGDRDIYTDREVIEIEIYTEREREREEMEVKIYTEGERTWR